MGEHTRIEWTDHTFNPWIGCAKVSPGCENCYAERDFDHRKHVAQWGPKGTRHVTSPANWKQPVKWDREALAAGRRAKVFCASLADVFEDRPDLVAPRAKLWSLVYNTPNLDWLLLTKRPKNVLPLLNSIQVAGAEHWPHHAWIGATIEGPAQLRRLDDLRTIPAAVRFLSCEPLLGDLGKIDLTGIHWVIAGGESGPAARPSHPRWYCSLLEQCANAGVQFFFKQWGEWAPVQDDTPRCGTLAIVARRGEWTLATSGYEPGCPVDSRPSDAQMVRVGKAAAGCILNGREWKESP